MYSVILFGQGAMTDSAGQYYIIFSFGGFKENCGNSTWFGMRQLQNLIACLQHNYPAGIIMKRVRVFSETFAGILPFEHLQLLLFLSPKSAIVNLELIGGKNSG